MSGHTEGKYVIWLMYIVYGDAIFIEGVGGSCSETEADDLYESAQYVKKHLDRNTLIWPGHSFGQVPRTEFSFLLDNN